MPSTLSQILDAGESSIEGIGSLLDFMSGDIDRKEYKKRAYEGRAITEEMFRDDDKVYSPKDTSTFDEDIGYVNYGHVPNEFTMDQLAEIKESKKNKESEKKFYRATYGDKLIKEGYTSQSFDERHPLAQAMGWKLEEETAMDDAGWYERVVHGSKIHKDARAFPTAKTKAGSFVDFEDTGLSNGSSEIYVLDKLITKRTEDAVEKSLLTMDDEQKAIVAKTVDVLDYSKKQKEAIKLSTFEPEDGTATQAPIQKHFKKYSLKEQEEAANKLSEIDESTTGGSFSPKGAGNYEDIIKDPIIKQNALETYKQIEGEDISEMKERDQEAVLKTFASEQSNNITKMLQSMGETDSRKARRLSTFLKAYRSSDLTAGQFAEGTLTTFTDPMTAATAITGGVAAIPLKAGLKKALVSGGVDAALTGLAQSVAEQTREKTAGNIDEISGKEIAKHMGIAMVIGTGMSAGMHKLSNKKLKDMTDVEKEIFAEELVKQSDDVDPKMEGMFKRAVDRAAEADSPEGMSGMFERASRRGKDVEEPEVKTDVVDEVVTELEKDKVHSELRQKIHAEEKEKDKESVKEDDVTYKNRVKNLVTQRLLPESVEGAKREVPIASKGTQDIYDYQTQGRLSGKDLAEKSQRTAEMISTERMNTREFVESILDSERTKQKVTKIEDHPLKQDLETTKTLIDSLNGRKIILEDAETPLKDKALKEHRQLMDDLVEQRNKLESKMELEEAEKVSRREYGKQFEEESTVEPFDFTTMKQQEKIELIDSRLKDIQKEHKWGLKSEQLEGKIPKAKEKEIDTFLNNLANELRAKVAGTKKEKGGLTVSTTPLSKKEKSIINKIKVVQSDRANGMPDNLFKAEVADLMLKAENLDYAKNLTEESFSKKKARTQKLLEQLDVVISDARKIEPKEEVKEKPSYKDRKAIPKEEREAKQKEANLHKTAAKNKWPMKKQSRELKSKILDDFINSDKVIRDEERSWSKILKEAIDEKVISKTQAQEAYTPERWHKGSDRGIFNYDEFRAEKIARIAEKVNEAKAEKELGLDLGVVRTGELVSQNEAIDFKFSNLQITSVATGDIEGFKAIGAIGKNAVDKRHDIGSKSLDEIGISKEAKDRLGENGVKAIVKLALGNEAYTEGMFSVVRKLTKFFEEKNVIVDTTRLVNLYNNIKKNANEAGMGVLSRYAKDIQEAVKSGRIEPVLKFKNFDGKVENIKVHDDMVDSYKFMSGELEVLRAPTKEDTRSGKVAALITQSMDAFIERRIRQAIGHKKTASVFDAFITNDKTKLDIIRKAGLDALQEINDKGGISYILRQIDLEGNYKDVPKIDLSIVNKEKLFGAELETKKVVNEVEGLDTVESFLMSHEGMAINSLLEGTISNKKGLDALRESVSNAMRIIEHTPEQVKYYKEELGYSDDAIGRRSDLEYSNLDKMAGQVLKASTLADLAVIAERHVPKGKTQKQTQNWHTAMQKVVEAQRRFMEQKANYTGKRLFVDKNGEDIGAGKKSLKEFFNEISIVDKELLREELSIIDKAEEFVKRTESMPRRTPERKAIEANDIKKAEEHIIKSKSENKQDILTTYALKARSENGGVESPKGLYDRHTKNKLLRETKKCAN